MGEAKTDDGTLYFEIHGEGEPLVLICGLTGSVDYYWHTVLEELATTYQVIIFDSRGAGQTKYSCNGFLIEHIADDLSHLLDYLGIEKCSILGHSMGSAVAQSFAHKYPTRVDNLILCNTFTKLNTRDRVMVEGILSFLEEDIPMKKIIWSLMPWIFSNHHLENDDRKEKLKEFYASRELCAVGFKQQIDALLVFDSTEWIPEVDTNTLVIASTEDIMFPPEYGEKLAACMLNARFVIFQCGHAIPVEKPSELINLIKDFLPSEESPS